MADHEEMIQNFKAITGVDQERAVFFLQSAAWNMEVAMSSFYDDESNTSVQSSGTLQGVSDSNLGTGSTSTSLTSPQQEPVQATGGRGGIATLADYREKPKPSRGEDAQQFYAGGSEHSGQMIEGPPRKKMDPENMAKDIFEAAKEHGAVKVEDEEREEQERQAAPFQGSGFRLGDVEGPSVAVTANRPPPPKPETVRHTLTFWRDGFSVDDGPLRTGESEEDRSFMGSVRKGEIPKELLRGAMGSKEVDVDIQDKRNEAYVRPKPKVVAFSGQGRKLGSVAPEVVSHSTPSSGATANPSPLLPTPTVPLDETQPTTTLQIRLADGTRLVAKFNHSHTVNDVRQFINMSRPSSSNYVLMTTFPNKELSDPTLTLSAAKLLNAVIVQRIR